jgi:hypothetical protein
MRHGPAEVAAMDQHPPDPTIEDVAALDEPRAGSTPPRSDLGCPAGLAEVAESQTLIAGERLPKRALVGERASSTGSGRRVEPETDVLHLDEHEPAASSPDEEIRPEAEALASGTLHADGDLRLDLEPVGAHAPRGHAFSLPAGESHAARAIHARECWLR